MPDEDLYDLGSMSDGEIHDLIVQELSDDATLDADAVDVEVEDGRVTLSGRVGTEDEVEAVERIVHDRLGVDEYENDLVVDELARKELPEAADDAAVESARIEPSRHVRGDENEPSAAHLRDDVEGDLYGTEDVQKAIEQGESYNAPDGAHEEGVRSRETH